MRCFSGLTPPCLVISWSQVEEHQWLQASVHQVMSETPLRWWSYLHTDWSLYLNMSSGTVNWLSSLCHLHISKATLVSGNGAFFNWHFFWREAIKTAQSNCNCIQNKLSLDHFNTVCVQSHYPNFFASQTTCICEFSHKQNLKRSCWPRIHKHGAGVTFETNCVGICVVLYEHDHRWMVMFIVVFYLTDGVGYKYC